jgi:hypothetical protein
MVYRKKTGTRKSVGVRDGRKGDPMGATAPVILKIETPDYKKVVVEATDGHRYYSDLSALSQVYCFPKSREDWGRVSIDSYGRALIWTSRFEVHIDQIIGLASKKERIQQSA